MLNERQLYMLNHPFAQPVECRAHANRVPKASAKAKFEAEILEKEALMREYYSINGFTPMTRYTTHAPVISENTLYTNGAMDRFIRALDSYEYQRPPVEPRRYDYRYPRPAPRDNGQTLQSRNEAQAEARAANAARVRGPLNRLLGI